MLLSLHSQGCGRDLLVESREELRRKYEIDEFHALYTFYYPGFNLRATDLQAFIGLQQMKKIEFVIEKRNENFKLYQSLIKNDFWKIAELENTFVSNFCYPVITKNIKNVTEKMRENGIEIKPLVCGSISRHPFWFERYGR
jgi:CDP-6-deoxy-D-xylo-4-hexulose-3-dehydrase